MTAQITSGRGDRFIIVDTQNNSIVTNAVILFPMQDEEAYYTMKQYNERDMSQKEQDRFLELLKNSKEVWDK